ncbi:RcnB family protein [Rhodoferax sp. WC2427]|uniref:RcnB family protein n=1 Tax=Rhodoferax sp. WC2427 TaxID=3234144 RepID=UPI003465E0C8
MKKTAFVAALTAASLAISGLAFAQGNGHGGDEFQRKNQQHEQAHNRPNNNRGPGPQRMPEPHRNGPDFAQERGAGPEHNFRRGGRLPSQYRNNQYVVDNWRDHHLSAPPRGYHWVQTGGDYVLIAITTGIIAQILLGNY